MCKLSAELRQYLVITASYWTFTLTDGALRMLVLLHFHQLGYTPLQIALLFLFYEFFGVVTNLLGGWLGARLGLNRTMNLGLALQVVALGMMMVPSTALTVPWVMAAQGLSGIAKDLNKMSAKSAIKFLVADEAQGTLYRWVALLTGSKNALKGAGFFLGGALLTLLGFRSAMATMAVVLALVWLFNMVTLQSNLGKAANKPKFRQIFSKSAAINQLSLCRLFLFASRDVWFVVALPVYLATTLQWDFVNVGGFMAVWIIGYGAVQAVAPYLTGLRSGRLPDGRDAMLWAVPLAAVPAFIAYSLTGQLGTETVLLGGLLLFGFLFAINSSLHSYLIVSYANRDGASLDVGFYYMANAMGRLIGTLLSGWLYQRYGLPVCLWVSAGFIVVAAALSISLPRSQTRATATG